MKFACGPVLDSSRVPWKNLIFRMQTNVVLRGPATVEYSHDRIAKKNAPSHSCAMATLIFNNLSRFIVRNTRSGSAF